MKNHTNVIASLKTTNIDTRLLNVSKSLKVNNKDVATSVKHPNDTREVITENDLWGSWAEIKDGEIIFHDDELSNPNNNSSWNRNISKVEDNKAYIGDTLFANIQTEKIKKGVGMFSGSENLTSFKSDLSSLDEGDWMFEVCPKLTSFTSDLSSLTNGTSMFASCPRLTSFSADLSSLTNGSGMFYECSDLATFTSDLSSLYTGEFMFLGCLNLTTFTSNLSTVINGNNMFNGCRSLSKFESDLSSLNDGRSMFNNSILDAKSVMNIIHFLSTKLYPSNISIGIDIPNTEEAKQAFAEECYCDSWQELNDEFTAKNWTVEWRFNGASTMSLRGANTSVYAKLEEVIMPSEEELSNTENQKRNIGSRNYEYTSKDGSKFYNILWYHDSNTENEEYELFDSIGHAIEAFGVVPKE